MATNRYTVRPLGCCSWSTERTLTAARRSARQARSAGLRAVVIVDERSGAVVE